MKVSNRGSWRTIPGWLTRARATSYQKNVALGDFGAGLFAAITEEGIGLQVGPNHCAVGDAGLVHAMWRLYPSQPSVGTSATIHWMEISVPWEQLSLLEAVEPWPNLLVDWGAGSKLFTPHGTLFSESPSEERCRAFGEVVERLFREIPNFMPRYGSNPKRGKARAGWLAFPHVTWEPAEKMPAETGDVGVGPFRRAAGPRKILAIRRKPTPMGGLLLWLSSRPGKEWRKTPKQLVLTEDRVFAEFFGGKIVSIPRSALRRASGDEDRVYLFGRGTQLVLTDAHDCEVAEALNAQLLGEANTRSG